MFPRYLRFKTGDLKEAYHKILKVQNIMLLYAGSPINIYLYVGLPEADKDKPERIKVTPLILPRLIHSCSAE